MKLLFISPAFEREYGGVQASARAAWSGFCAHSSMFEARQLTYRSRTGGAKFASKLALLARASRMRTSFDFILVWHLGLLKLLSLLPRTKARVAVFLHGIEAWQPLDAFTSRLLGKADVLLHNSSYTWRRFVEMNPAFAGHPHEHVALGIDERIETDWTEPVSPPAVLMIGRLDPRENYKGHQEVIEAWPAVQTALRNAELWIAGDGPLAPKLQDRVRHLKLEGSVRFFGSVSESYKHELLCRSRCLALPSRGEGFGLVYLEAMRVGRPCLVSTSDAGREVIAPPQAGLAVDVTNPDEIAAALIELLKANAAWRQMSNNARCRYEALFTAAHFQRRLLDAVFGASASLQAQAVVA